MLSVVIPNYNHSAYLRASLEGVLAQARGADEIIVVDDASTDDSFAVASSFLDRHPNFRLVQNSRNLGCVPTLNRGLALARGSILPPRKWRWPAPAAGKPTPFCAPSAG